MLVQVQVIGNRLFSLTYKLENFDSINPYDLLEISLRSKQALGIFIGKAPNQDEASYDYQVKLASKSKASLTELQKILLGFIASYYLQPLGISTQIFVLKDKYSLIESKKPKSPKAAKESLDSDPNLSLFASPRRSKKRVVDNACTDSKSKPPKAAPLPPPVDKSRLSKLSSNQEEVFGFCLSRPLSLIFGVTGSGKTEIYLHLIFDSITQGKQALFLMPEIALTPQIKSRLESAFPNRVGIWHSGQSESQKKAVLEGLESGRINIIAGARSALFLPYENLGLIIVDECHDDSYKSSSQPKYNAKDLCVYLSSKGLRVVLGSATPSTKDFYLARERGYLAHLKSSFHGGENKLLFDSRRGEGLLGEAGLAALRDVLAARRQAVVFVPVRANFKSLLCMDCGEKIGCPSCSVTLSLHIAKGLLLCHYCGFALVIPKACPSCGGAALSGWKIGTQEAKKLLEEELGQLGLSPRIGLFDRDSITSQSKLEKVLAEFRTGALDILVGTHMLAKGHDYHRVSLSLILGLDYMLAFQDYQAIERGFSLLYQVGGRSGRASDGVVMVQTDSNEALVRRLWGDYRRVLDFELEARLELYPPFARLALVGVSHVSREFANEAAVAIEATLRNLEKEYEDFEVVGLSEGALPKLKKKFYYQILLRAKKPLVLQSMLKLALGRLNPTLLALIDVDIDPLII